MPSFEKRTPVRMGRQPHLRDESIRRALIGFLGDLEAASENAACFLCGSTSDLRKTTASLRLAGDAEAWEMSILVCTSCTPEIRSSSAIVEDEVTSPVQNQVKSLEAEVVRRNPGGLGESRSAQLACEMKAIHTANVEYWRRGAEATIEERYEYRSRQKRTNELRVLAVTGGLGDEDITGAAATGESIQ